MHLAINGRFVAAIVTGRVPAFGRMAPPAVGGRCGTATGVYANACQSLAMCFFIERGGISKGNHPRISLCYCSAEQEIQDVNRAKSESLRRLKSALSVELFTAADSPFQYLGIVMP